MAAKYDALAAWLVRAGDGPVTVRFDDLDAVVRGGLPPAARRGPAWWSDRSPTPQAKAWSSVGRRVEAVDLAAGTVRFSAPSIRGSL